jgi:hypothetical protein
VANEMECRVPVDVSGVVIFDQHLPLVLRQHAAADPHRPMQVRVAVLVAAAEGIQVYAPAQAGWVSTLSPREARSYGFRPDAAAGTRPGYST